MNYLKAPQLKQKNLGSLKLQKSILDNSQHLLFFAFGLTTLQILWSQSLVEPPQNYIRSLPAAFAFYLMALAFLSLATFSLIYLFRWACHLIGKDFLASSQAAATVSTWLLTEDRLERTRQTLFYGLGLGLFFIFQNSF